MSKAPRPATWKTRSSSCAGHLRWLGHRRSLSPSFCCTRVVPHGGALGRHDPLREPLGPQRQDRPDDLGDHVPGLAQDHGVTGSHVLAPDLVGVVQGGVLDRGAGHPGGLHDAVRRHPAGATGVDLDGEQLGVDLLGRVLEGDRPAGARLVEPRRRCSGDVVDLDHDAVDLVADDRVPVLPHVVDEGLAPRRASATTRTWSEVGSPQARIAAYDADWAAGSKPSRAPRPWQTMPSDRVAVTRGSFCRSEPAAALRGLANSGLPASAIEALSRSNASAGRKTSPRTSTQRGHRELVGAGQAVRDRVDRLDVGRDVLAGAAVAAGQGAHQPALLVEQVDRQAVDLELAQQGRVPRARRGRRRACQAGELLEGERVVEALHALEVVDRR